MTSGYTSALRGHLRAQRKSQVRRGDVVPRCDLFGERVEGSTFYEGATPYLFRLPQVREGQTSDIQVINNTIYFDVRNDVLPCLSTEARSLSCPTLCI
jgi:hypothetical protein